MYVIELRHENLIQHECASIMSYIYIHDTNCATYAHYVHMEAFVVYV